MPAKAGTTRELVGRCKTTYMPTYIHIAIGVLSAGAGPQRMIYNRVYTYIYRHKIG